MTSPGKHQHRPLLTSYSIVCVHPRPEEIRHTINGDVLWGYCLLYTPTNAFFENQNTLWRQTPQVQCDNFPPAFLIAAHTALWHLQAFRYNFWKLGSDRLLGLRACPLREFAWQTAMRRLRSILFTGVCSALALAQSNDPCHDKLLPARFLRIILRSTVISDARLVS